MVSSEDIWHVSHVQKQILKFSSFWSENQKKTLLTITILKYIYVGYVFCCSCFWGNSLDLDYIGPSIKACIHSPKTVLDNLTCMIREYLLTTSVGSFIQWSGKLN